jgi:hypothetical protein
MTPARRYALLWFRDHERDPTSVLLRRRPTVKMARLMQRQGQLDVSPAGQFGYHRWRLSPKAHQLLEQIDARSTRTRRRKTAMENAAENAGVHFPGRDPTAGEIV